MLLKSFKDVFLYQFRKRNYYRCIFLKTVFPLIITFNTSQRNATKIFMVLCQLLLTFADLSLGLTI